MSEKDEVLEIFKKAGALLSGHFLLSSGLHSPTYFEKFAVLKNPQHLAELCFRMAEHFKKEKTAVPSGIETVIGPTTGGMLIAYEVAKNLGTKFLFAEAENGKRVLKRGFEIRPDEAVLIVDDILTTGNSVREVLELVESFDASIVGIGVLLDRSGGKVKFDYPLYSLATTQAETYPAESCPLCEKGEKLVKPGSRSF